MTALLISETFPPLTGGSGRWFWEIYRRFPRSQFVIAAGEDPGQEAFDRTHDLDVVRMPLSFTDLGMFSIRGWSGYYSALSKLIKLARDRKIDHVHAGR